MLGTRIAALRREAGLSQAELAQRLQVSPSALGMYEQERREPSMQTLVKLSRELGVTTDYLLRQGAEEEPQAAQSAAAAPHKDSGRDILERLGYLAKTKGYLLGWVLIGWGVLDLVVLLLMGLGVLNFMIW